MMTINDDDDDGDECENPSSSLTFIAAGFVWCACDILMMVIMMVDDDDDNLIAGQK